MGRGFLFSLIGLAAVLTTSCNRAASPADNSVMTPSVTLPVTVTADFSSAAAYPGPDAAATSVSAVAGAYPGPTDPIQLTATKPPLNTSTPFPTPTPVPLNIISQLKLSCAPQETFAQCYDETLRIEFEYPIEWGEITATLRTGGDAGYAYDYAFSAVSPEQALLLMAGGRSRDFAEGRGGMRTDFWGYGDELAEGGCISRGKDYPICEQIQPDVILLMSFPEAKYICDLAPGVLFSPIAMVEINLPDNPTINGFRFISPFLSQLLIEELNSAVAEILGYTPETGATKCDSLSQMAFDGRVAELIEEVKSGTVDDGTKGNVDSIRHIAESILFLR